MMSTVHTAQLREQIEDFQKSISGQIPPEVVASVGAETERLVRAGLETQALKVGEQAPDFTLPDAFGHPVTLSHQLQQGPVIITFYRGAWCPYCTLQLRAYQQAWPQIQDLGAALLAISPQTPDHSRATVEKNALTFPVLSDAGNAVARRFGLVHTIDEAARGAHRQMGADLPAFNGDASWELPMPGTFVVDQAGIVLLASVDPDFTHRLDPSTIIAGLCTRLATLAIEKAQLHVRTHQVATLAERQRIARDLHDSVTQTLAGLQAVAQAALDFWETRPAQSRAAVETIQHLARAASVEMRTLLAELRDMALQNEGLAGALEKHVAMIRHQSGLDVELEVVQDPRLPPRHEEALYRIAQEALANVVKHARAQRASVTVERREGWVGVRIEDDGLGFPAEGPAFDAFGLRGMRERAQALGGTVQVGNGFTGGAYVSADLPLARA